MALRKQTTIDALHKIIENENGNRAIGGLTGVSKAAFIASFFSRSQKPLVLLTPDRERGEVLLQDIVFFLSCFDPQLKFSSYLFPNWELLPYEPISPHKELSGKRLEVLDGLLCENNLFLLVLPVEAFIQKVLPGKALAESILRFGIGDEFSTEKARDVALSAGYTIGEIVEKHGEASIRGGLFDIFPSNSEFPFRIELFGDEVESIRAFDPATQRSVRELYEVLIVPSLELIMTDERMKEGLQRIKGRVEKGVRNLSTEHELFLSKIGEGIPIPGIEKFAPDFYGEMETILDYVPEKTLFVIDEPSVSESKGEKFFEMIYQEFHNSTERNEFFPPPESLYRGRDNWFLDISQTAGFSVSELHLTESIDSVNDLSVKSLSLDLYKGDIDRFLTDYTRWTAAGNKVCLSVRTKGQADRMSEIFLDKDVVASYCEPHHFTKGWWEWPDFSIMVGTLSKGIVLPDRRFVFVTEDELFGAVRRVKRRRKRKSETFSAGLADLKTGDRLVHIDYGIGEFQGTREMSTGQFTEEFLIIEYADNNKLFVPMDSLGSVQKLVGAGEKPLPLDRLEGVAWRRTKQRVKKSLMKMADALLKLYAARTLVEGFSFSSDGHFHREFADSFEYTETEDQLHVISEIAADMEKPMPMDRIVCGDVGYGKTEVAMRAVFKAVMDGKQAAILVPTTLLSTQHAQTFLDRFHAFPVNIEALNRFKTPAEQKEIVRRVASGNVDVVIGTHRLLQKDIVFKDLGLVVIDEEQRFGVAHKEKLKTLREQTDVLTLTATPIPRTLHFAMMGVRDLSVIDTPPQNRLSIKTYVKRFDDELIRQAITRELDRCGQVFFLHNRVESIYAMAEYVKEIVPFAKIGVVHGQLNKAAMEKVMEKFLQGHVNVLLCTTIIESGLDVPSANTIIINRADKFGLAQLYQLRGRVGRDKHQAFAYLLVPGEDALTEIAFKRLTAIEELSELGSGFKLAARDLEIRGAGNLLGGEQSGQISSVGFDLYCRLMEETVRELKGEPPLENFDPTLNISIKGFIPKEYVEELNQRLELYKRLDQLGSEYEIKDLREEVRDRYGPIPDPVNRLLTTVYLKILCKKLKIEKIESVRGGVALTFDSENALSPEKVFEFLKGRRDMRFTSELILRITIEEENWEKRCGKIKGSLQALADHCVSSQSTEKNPKEAE